MTHFVEGGSGAPGESRPPQGWWRHWQQLSDEELVARFDSAMDELDQLQRDRYASSAGVLEWLEMAKLARDEINNRASERLTKAALKEARAANRLAMVNGVLALVAVVIAVIALVAA